jgi:hypothetical protein
MSTDSTDEHTDDPADERDGSLPILKTWWTELSVAGKVLVPTTALVLVFVTANTIPAFVF